MAKSDKYIKAGGIGAVIAAICCFTPVLAIFLGMIGLGVITGYLDHILFPFLLICLVFLVMDYSSERKRRRPVVIMKTFQKETIHDRSRAAKGIR